MTLHAVNTRADLASQMNGVMVKGKPDAIFVTQALREERALERYLQAVLHLHSFTWGGGGGGGVVLDRC